MVEADDLLEPLLERLADGDDLGRAEHALVALELELRRGSQIDLAVLLEEPPAHRLGRVEAARVDVRRELKDDALLAAAAAARHQVRVGGAQRARGRRDRPQPHGRRLAGRWRRVVVRVDDGRPAGRRAGQIRATRHHDLGRAAGARVLVRIGRAKTRGEPVRPGEGLVRAANRKGRRDLQVRPRLVEELERAPSRLVRRRSRDSLGAAVRAHRRGQLLRRLPLRGIRLQKEDPAELVRSFRPGLLWRVRNPHRLPKQRRRLCEACGPLLPACALEDGGSLVRERRRIALVALRRLVGRAAGASAHRDARRQEARGPALGLPVTTARHLVGQTHEVATNHQHLGTLPPVHMHGAEIYSE